MAFAALVIAQALITVAWPYLPTEDGPAHVATAVILTRNDAAYWQYFRLDPFPSPNLGGYLLLVALVGLRVPPLLAEKLLVAGVLVGLPFALRAALLEIRRGAVALTYIALPLAINWFVYAGFYNFSLGVVVFIATVGRWIRSGADRPGQLALWLLAGYLCHAATFVMTLVFLTVHLVWTHGVAATSSRASLARLWADGRRLGLASAPALALLGVWFVTHRQPGVTIRQSWTSLFANLVTLRWGLVVFRETETIAAALLTVTLAGLTVWVLGRARPWRLRDPRSAWLIAAGVALLLYLAVPDFSSSGGLLSRRLSIFPWLALLLWLAQMPLPRRLAQAVAAVGIAAAVALTAIRLPIVAEFNRDLAEFLSAAPLFPRSHPGAALFH